MRRHRSHDNPPWLAREIGGAPYWLLIACAVIVVAIGGVVLLSLR